MAKPGPHEVILIQRLYDTQAQVWWIGSEEEGRVCSLGEVKEPRSIKRPLREDAGCCLSSASY